MNGVLKGDPRRAPQRKADVAKLAEPGRPAASSQLFSRSDLLRWIYLGRLTLVTGILAGALLAWLNARPEDTLVVIVMFLVAYAVTAGSFWYSHVLGREPGENFLYAQVILDVLIVTGVVHVTRGPESGFAPLYILVVSSGALLLPLPGGVLIGGLASMVYFGDLVWGYQGAFGLDVGLQIGLFTLVALLTGLVGDRLRRAGQALGVVESELRQLRLDTGDILANLATGVLTVDPGGRLAYANPAAEQLLGISTAEWLGREVVDEVERRAPGMGRVLLRALRDGRAVDRFRTRLAEEGRNVRLGVSTAVLDRGEGASPSATAIFQDITDLESLEALNRRTERLEAVAALSASLAHEIKNPLASIRSAVEQLTRPSLQSADRETLQRLVLGDRTLDLRPVAEAANVARHAHRIRRLHRPRPVAVDIVTRVEGARGDVAGRTHPVAVREHHRDGRRTADASGDRLVLRSLRAKRNGQATRESRGIDRLAASRLPSRRGR